MSTHSRSNSEEISQAETQTFLLYLTRAGWFISADFVDRVWTVHRTPADHWRALQLPFVLKQLSSLSDLIICQGCVEDEFHPSQCSQTNQTGGQCVVLLAGHRGSLWALRTCIYIAVISNTTKVNEALEQQHQQHRGGGGTRPIFGYRWAVEILKPWPCLAEQKILKYIPCLWQHPQFYYLFRTKDKMNAVLFAVEKIYVMVIDFVYLEYKQISSTRLYQSRTQNYILCLRQRGQKPYPVQRHIVPLIGHPPGNSQFRGFRCVMASNDTLTLPYLLLWLG